jgi:hypothetical protein
MMRILVATIALIGGALVGNPSTPPESVTQIRICSTREPKLVDQRFHEFQESPLLNKRVNLNMLSAADILIIQSINQSIQQAVERGLTWDPGQTIRIAFLSGDPIVQKHIKASAVKWTSIINLKFQFVDDPSTAAVRIGIDLNGKSESQIGKVALQIDSSKETMHFGWLTAASSQADYDSVVLHEFGHALGMLHEHQIPSSTIVWNTAFVYEYCKTKWGWSQADVDHNIFEKYTPEMAIFTRMDPNSIMMYSFPTEWSANTPPISTPWNYQLSPADKEFMAIRYPKTTAPKIMRPN